MVFTALIPSKILILFGICGMTLFLFFTAVDTFVPKVNYKHSNRPPWISKDLAKDINNKETLWRRAKNSKSPQQVEKFRKLRQQIKNRLRYERRNYVKEISNETYRTSKRFWSFFSFKCKKKPIPDKVTYNGFSFSDDRGRAEAFDGFLNSIYKDHSKCVIDLNAPILPCVTEQLSHVTVSVDEVVDILRSLDTKKAIGHDKLPTIVFKECADPLAPSITAIINFSLNKGFQLSDWKKSKCSSYF